jgi:YD repeat-containing protein
VTSSYTYDRDGDRLTRVDGAVSTTFVYDRTDELVSQSVGGGGSTFFAYDANGNLTSSRDMASGLTTSAYDAADRLRTLTPPAGSADADLAQRSAKGRFEAATRERAEPG